MNRLWKKAGAVIVAVVAAGILTQSWHFTIAVVSLVIAVAAEIDISMHRRDHERRSRARREGDPQ